MDEEKKKNQEENQNEPIIEASQENSQKEGYNFYELSFLLDPRLNEVELGEEVSKIEKIIKDCQGEIIEENWPQKIELAYSVKKNNFAYFGFILFDSLPECVKMFPEKVKYEPKILRYLTIKRNKKIWQEEKERPKVPPKSYRKPSKEEATKSAKEEKELDEEKLEERLEEILK